MSTHTCHICGEDHVYRNCTHPSIDHMDTRTKFYYRLAQCHPRRYRHLVKTWTENMPIAYLRKLIQLNKTVLPHLFSSRFISLSQWRLENDIHEIEYQLYQGNHASIQNVSLPERIGIISTANKKDLFFMFTCIYTKEAIIHIADNTEMQHAQSARFYADQATQAMRDARHGIGSPYISVDSLDRTLESTIEFLQHIRDTIQNTNPIQNTIRYSTHLRTRYEDSILYENVVDHIYDANNDIPALEYMESIIPTQIPSSLGTRLRNIRDIRMNTSIATPPMTPRRLWQPPTAPSRPLRRQRRQNTHVCLPVVQNILPHDQAQTDAQCSICWDQLGHQDLTVTDCGHTYCTTCITQHTRTTRINIARSDSLQQVLSCPMCRHHIQNITHFQEFHETQQNDTPTAVLELGLLLNSAITQHADQYTHEHGIAHTDQHDITVIDHSGLQILDALLNETNTPTTAIV